MEINITRSSISFKNPAIGQPTRAVKEHYNGRMVTVLLDGMERVFTFGVDELPFESSEDDMRDAVRDKIASENDN